MHVVRPARVGDVERLRVLAETAGVGLTTLPREPEAIAERVRESEHALSREVRRPAGETYLFVMEDLLTGALCGLAGIVARVGGFEPFYAYALETSVHESAALGVRREVPTLHLVTQHQGPSEIGTLYLSPDARGAGLGRLLSLSRLLFIAGAPRRFDVEVIAEMRGVLDARGNSPFWEAVGRHFFDMDFADADCRTSTDKQFIADLMPKHPIYLPLLPAEVQAVIGAVHEQTKPALHLLRAEGFGFGGQVDIFDAGPLYRARRENIRVIRDSVSGVFHEVAAAPLTGPPMLVSNDRLAFRAVASPATVTPPDGGADGDVARVALPHAVALALEIRLGDRVRVVPLRPPTM